MPIERRSTRTQATTIVMMVCGVVVVALAVWLLIRAASGGELRLGDDRFNRFDAESAADSIAEDGPLLFSDVSGRGQNRPIFVTHDGDDHKVGWHVFDARAPEAPSGCFLEWDAGDRLFRSVDGCHPGTFPANGEGLRQYPWKVTEDGTLDIDLNPPDAAATTTTSTP